MEIWASPNHSTTFFVFVFVLNCTVSRHFQKKISPITAWLSFHSLLEHCWCFANVHALQGKLQNFLCHNLTPHYLGYFLIYLQSKNTVSDMGDLRVRGFLSSYVAGKSVSEGHTWHSPDSPACRKHQYSQAEMVRNVLSGNTETSTPYKADYVSSRSVGIWSNLSTVIGRLLPFPVFHYSNGKLSGQLEGRRRKGEYIKNPW